MGRGKKKKKKASGGGSRKSSQLEQLKRRCPSLKFAFGWRERNQLSRHSLARSAQLPLIS